MELDKFNKFLEKQYESPWEDDDFEDEAYYNSDDYLFKGQDDDMDSGMENVCELIRDMFNLTGIKSSVEYKGLDIMVYVEMKRKDNLRNLTKVFDVVKKLKKDVLLEYDSEFELWKTKSGNPLLMFSFFSDGASPF